eukprot:4681350-Prymnesium_polylepis.1
MSDAALQQWRPQLAEEDSDDEDLGGNVRFNADLRLNTADDEDDLGLDLAVPPVTRLDQPPARQTHGPPPAAVRAPPRGGAGMSSQSGSQYV